MGVATAEDSPDTTTRENAPREDGSHEHESHDHGAGDHDHDHRPQQPVPPGDPPPPSPSPSTTPAPPEVQDVVVTGTRTEKLGASSPVRVQTVTRERMDRRRVANLAEALDANTGVRVENNCQNCGFSQVRLNGLDGRYAQILIDNRPVYSTLAGVYGLEHIPEEMIERVEIVKGGGSALYGGSAVAGVINVITKRPRTSYGNATTRMGFTGLRAPELRASADASVVSDDGRLAVHVHGSAVRREAWDGNGDGFSDLGLVRATAVGTGLYWDAVDGGTLTLKGHVLREHRRGGDRLDAPEHDAAIAESVHTTRFGSEVGWKHRLSSRTRYELAYAMAYTERDSYYGAGGDVRLPALPDDPTQLGQEEWSRIRGAMAQKQAALGAYGRTRNPVHTVDAFAHHDLDIPTPLTLTLGLQHWVDALRDSFPAYDRRISQTFTDTAGIVQADWLATKWAELVSGVRVDRHSQLEAPVASPRVALLTKPADSIRLRSVVSTGFRAPQVFDEDLHITIVGGQGQVVVNAPGLDPERSVSLTQNVEVSGRLAERVTGRAGITGFYTAIRDAFALDVRDDPTTANELETVRINQGRTRVAGLELDGELRYANRIGGGAGLTLERATNASPDPDFGTHRVLRTPQAYGYAEMWGRPLEDLVVSSTLELTGTMKVPHYAGYIPENRLETSPIFWDWSVSVSYKAKVMRDGYVQPFLTVKNLLDSFQRDMDVGPLRDSGYLYGPRLPRTVLLGLRAGI